LPVVEQQPPEHLPAEHGQPSGLPVGLEQAEAAAMESLERLILAELGVPDPYSDPMSPVEPAAVQP